MILKKRYQLHYHSIDYKDLVPVKEDVFYADENNLVYLQFFKGQLIPTEVFLELFGDTNLEVKIEEDTSNTEEAIEVEDKTKRKGRK